MPLLIIMIPHGKRSPKDNSFAINYDPLWKKVSPGYFFAPNYDPLWKKVSLGYFLTPNYHPLKKIFSLGYFFAQNYHPYRKIFILGYLIAELVQVFFAVLVGFVMVLIFYYGGSLIPCIVFHSANNALKAFSAEGSMDPKVEMILNVVLIVVVLGGYLLYLVKVLPNKKISE